MNDEMNSFLSKRIELIEMNVRISVTSYNNIV